MSSSTYFKITTKSNHNYPEIELKYLLFSEWDVWNVETLKEIDLKDSQYHTETIFLAVIFELDADESKGIIEKVKAKAKYLNVDIDIIVVPHFITNEDALNYTIENAVENEIKESQED